jgi:hypothetical protein
MVCDEIGRQEEDKKIEEIGKVCHLDTGAEKNEEGNRGRREKRRQIWGLVQEGLNKRYYASMYKRIVIVECHIDIERRIPRGRQMREIILNPEIIHHGESTGKKGNEKYDEDRIISPGFHLIDFPSVMHEQRKITHAWETGAKELS